MGIPVGILGRSGAGKSASMRNFQQGDVAIINVSGKPLPFKGGNLLAPYPTDNYDTIWGLLQTARTDCIVVDDAQYLMANEFMRNAKIKGFDKFTDLASHFWKTIQLVIHALPENRIVYFLMHSELDDAGNEKMKTLGRLLDEKITIEGLFTIILKAITRDGEHGFTTRTNGSDPVKSPIGMFDSDFIDNDLNAVDRIVREYYGFPANRRPMRSKPVEKVDNNANTNEAEPAKAVTLDNAKEDKGNEGQENPRSDT